MKKLQNKNNIYNIKITGNNAPYNTCTPEGVDECVSWGDYFYMEALTRLTKDWELYW